MQPKRTCCTPSRCMFNHYDIFVPLWKKIVSWKKIILFLLFFLLFSSFRFCFPFFNGSCGLLCVYIFIFDLGFIFYFIFISLVFFIFNYFNFIFIYLIYIIFTMAAMGHYTQQIFNSAPVWNSNKVKADNLDFLALANIFVCNVKCRQNFGRFTNDDLKQFEVMTWNNEGFLILAMLLIR